MQVLGLDRYEDAQFTIDTLHAYLISAAPKVAQWHVPHRAQAYYEHKKSAPPDFVDLANQ